MAVMLWARISHEVGAHVVDRDGLAPVGMVVVAIDPEDPDRLPVDEQLPVADLDPRDADLVLLGVPRPGPTDRTARPARA